MTVARARVQLVNLGATTTARRTARRRSSTAITVIAPSFSHNSNRSLVPTPHQRPRRSSFALSASSSAAAAAAAAAMSTPPEASPLHDERQPLKGTRLGSILAYINESTKFIVSAAAFATLVAFPNVQTCWQGALHRPLH